MQVFFIDSSRNGITLGLSANRKYSGTQAVMGGQTSGCPVIRSSLEAIAKATRGKPMRVHRHYWNDPGEQSYTAASPTLNQAN